MNVEIRRDRPAAADADDAAILPSGLKVGTYGDMADSPDDLTTGAPLGEILTLCRDTVEGGLPPGGSGRRCVTSVGTT